MNLKKIVGMNLKFYRYQSGLSQEKFYTKLELNPKYLANIERGKENISIDYIEELAQKLNVSIHDLILYNEEHLVHKKRIDERMNTHN